MSGDRENLNQIRNTLLQSLRKLDEQLGGTSVIEVHPTGVPAHNLPVVILYDVADCLRVHGLRVADAAEQDPKIWAVLLTALGGVVDAVPTEFGGRAER